MRLLCGLPGRPRELEWERWLASDRAGYAFVARIVRDVIAADMLTPGQRARLREAAS